MAKIVCTGDDVENGTFIHDKYVKLDKLGSGGFGTVWKGYRLTDSFPVAIKEIPGDKVTQWGQLGGETIPMEAVVLTKLKRVAGVIRILDVGVDGDKYIIVMERPTRMVDLFDYITDRGRLPSHEARYIFKLVLNAVIGCRRRGVFHGDVKDENILIDVDDKQIKLIDFGGAMEWTHRPYNTFLGTGLWAAPECNKREAFFPECATAWSLGCLVYTMLYGDIPFKTKTKAAKANYDVFKLATVVRDRRARDLIARCLLVDADRRPTLSEICDHPWLKPHHHPQPPPPPPPSSWVNERPRTAEDWLRSRMAGVAAASISSAPSKGETTTRSAEVNVKNKRVKCASDDVIVGVTTRKSTTTTTGTTGTTGVGERAVGRKVRRENDDEVHHHHHRNKGWQRRPDAFFIGDGTADNNNNNIS